MAAAVESRDLKGVAPLNAVGPHPSAAPTVASVDGLRTPLGSCRVYLGDSGGLAEVQIPRSQLTTELTGMAVPPSEQAAMVSLTDLFDSLIADADSDAVGAVVFADGDVAGIDWAELSLSAAGSTTMVQSRRVFTGDTTPTALKSLRTWASDQLGIRGADCPNLLLVISELVTNVERYSPGWVMVDLIFHPGMLLVAVTDRGVDSLPQFEVGTVDDESGRGLWIVATVSSAWGVVCGASSKTVWALLPCGYEEAPS